MKQKLFTRNFTLLLLGQACSLAGNYTLKFALSMYVLEQTGSASVFAGLLALAMLPTILLSPFGGILGKYIDNCLKIHHIVIALLISTKYGCGRLVTVLQYKRQISSILYFFFRSNHAIICRSTREEAILRTRRDQL